MTEQYTSDTDDVAEANRAVTANGPEHHEDRREVAAALGRAALAAAGIEAPEEP